MCNLYRLSGSTSEIASLFDVTADSGVNVPGEVYPGYPGLVVAEKELRAMAWGFPYQQTGKSGQPIKPKAVNNARSDRLHTKFWRSSFEQRRCLIPVSAFAEPEGPKREMTRTWLSVGSPPPFACAGIWRDSDEWGPVYSMVMTNASPAVKPFHDRMPVILAPSDYQRWMQGSPAQAFELCEPWTGEMEIERTEERWYRRKLV